MIEGLLYEMKRNICPTVYALILGHKGQKDRREFHVSRFFFSFCNEPSRTLVTRTRNKRTRSHESGTAKRSDKRSYIMRSVVSSTLHQIYSYEETGKTRNTRVEMIAALG
jgi:hypothetical protein